MSDLAERLRSGIERDLYDEAADEIERLRAENVELKEEVTWFANKPDGQAVEIKRLKKEIERLNNELWESRKFFPAGFEGSTRDIRVSDGPS